jgi:tripartite-type tricarboxylate transporter receptor subunit TctC
MLVSKIKSILFKTVGIMLVLFTMLVDSSVVLAADPYPNKPVRLILPFAPGGGSDGVARPIVTKLSERLGQQVYIDYRGGAGSVIGTDLVANAKPDGYTLLWITTAYVSQPALQKLPYDPVKSFTPIARLATSANVLVIHPSLPVKSVKELITLAKQKPGYLIFGSTGVGGSMHLGTELFRMMAGIDLTIAHFKGGGPAMIDLLGGHSHALLVSIVPTLPHIKSGKLRALGTGGVTRSVMLPDVPTIAEDGLPGYTLDQWFAMLAPAGTPEPIIDRLNQELKAVLASDEVQKMLLKAGSEVAYMPGPTEFGKFLGAELTTWARVAKQGNIKVEVTSK